MTSVISILFNFFSNLDRPQFHFFEDLNFPIHLLLLKSIKDELENLNFQKNEIDVGLNN